ncbi:MAG: hypothetical protein J0H42_04205 [Rhizobiales bacterium]|nr:hypothetical protein [Hyphomicrobiales bacterium]
MTPADAIASLDAQLRQSGEDITLRRVFTGSAPVDVVCRARVNRVDNSNSASGPKVALYEVFLSPTEINAAGWPGDRVVEPVTIDQRIPRENGPDRVLMRGENARTIIQCDPKFIGSTLVRINLRVSG